MKTKTKVNGKWVIEYEFMGRRKPIPFTDRAKCIVLAEVVAFSILFVLFSPFVLIFEFRDWFVNWFEELIGGIFNQKKVLRYLHDKR